MHGLPRDCNLSEDLENLGKTLYWKPETDVVLLRHEREPYQCDERSICNAHKPCYRFLFDERVRFVAMPKDVFEYGGDTEIIRIPKLEIVFVIVDFMPDILRWEKMGRSQHAIETSVNEMREELEKEWRKATVYLFDISPWEERFGSMMSNVQIKAVTGLLDIEERVAATPLPAKQVEAHELTLPETQAEE